MSRASFDDAFRSLASRERRRLLVSLLEKNPKRAVVRAAEEVHEDERNFELLQTELYHTHLPLLEEMGFIRWDRAEDVVEKGPRFDEIRRLLDLIHTHRDELPEGWI